MTSNLDELKAALYKDFDMARDRARACSAVGFAEFNKAAAQFMEAAAMNAQAIIAIEQIKNPPLQAQPKIT